MADPAHETTPRRSRRHDEAVTRPTDADVAVFLDAVDHPVRRRDALTLLELMRRVTGAEPRLWGPSIVGFGSYHYRYASGREGDAPAAGFSPRKAATTVYILDGFEGREALLASLGPHTLGKSCLYLKDLTTTNLAALETLVRASHDSLTHPH